MYAGQCNARIGRGVVPYQIRQTKERIKTRFLTQPIPEPDAYIGDFLR
jgi:hypothetical protein